MSNMREFLDQMREEGLKATGGGAGLGVVGKVLVQFGVHRFVPGHDFWEFWAEVKKPEEAQAKAAELGGKLKEAGVTDSPNFGLRVTVLKDTLSADAPYKKDLTEFTPQWQADAYKLIEDAIFEGDLPVSEVFYGQVQYKANPFHVAKGEAGKTDKDQNGNPRYPSIRVPVRKFKDEAEARAFVQASGAKSAGDNIPPFSEKAKASYTYNWPKSLMDLGPEIHDHLAKARQGIPFMNDAVNHKLPDQINALTTKQYIAGIYDIEPTDIDLLSVEVPFG